MSHITLETLVKYRLPLLSLHHRHRYRNLGLAYTN